MKLESPFINPISFRSGTLTELEAESYRSANILDCQMYERTDNLQFIIYFTKDDATHITVQCNGVDVITPTAFTSAVEDTFSNAFYFGKRRFNVGYLIFKKQLLAATFAATDLIFSVKLYKIGKSVALTSNNITIGTGGKLIKYSNTYDNSVCDFSLLPGLFEYRFDGMFYKTDFQTEAEIFKGNKISEVVQYSSDEYYTLNIGGKNMISLEEERKIRHILGCNVKMIDGVEFELTPEVDIASTSLFRRAGRAVDIKLMRKTYQSSVLSVTGTTGTGTITTEIPVRYDDTQFTFAVDPASLTSITTTGGTLSKTLVNGKDIVTLDFGINQNLDANREIVVTVSDSENTKDITINQKYSGLLFGDAIMNKNLILRKLP
jgi:hypothetical protein